jgi:DUF3102 family protein
MTTPTSKPLPMSGGVPGLADLPESDLIKRIQGELDEIKQTESSANRSVVRHALTLGELLIHAKSRSGQYGKWAKWLKDNFKLSQKTAERYMNLKEGWPKVEALVKEGKIDTVSNLSFRQAMKIIKPSNGNGGSGDYDSVENRLKKKLNEMDAATAEAAAQKTITELTQIVSTKLSQRWKPKLAA